MRFAPTTFRPTFGRVLSVVVALIAAAALAGLVVSGDLNALVRYGWGLLLLAATGIALFWLPSLAVEEHAVTVRNVFSTVTIPWPAIERIDTKYALTIYTAAGRVPAWASPAPSRYASQVSNTSDARLAARASGSNIRPGDLLSTTSGAAAFVIRSHWEDLREDGLLAAGPEAGSVRRDIHWVTIAVLGGLALATALGLLL
jgi:hypothetical protein